MYGSILFERIPRLLPLLFAALVLYGQPVPNRSSSIEGVVSNLLTGAPVRKARILAVDQSNGGTARECVSGADGRFFLGEIPPGPYRISVEREGFIPAFYGAKAPGRSGKILVLAPGQKAADLHIYLQPPGVISGHLSDADGEPLQGLGVAALHLDLASGSGRYVSGGTATTDDTGAYRLFGLPPGRYRVMSLQQPVNGTGADQPGGAEQVYPSMFYPGTLDFRSAAVLNIAPGGEAREIDFRIPKTIAVTVRGVVNTRLPSAAAPVVKIVRKDRLFVFPGPQGAGFATGAGGGFELHGVTPGTYILSGTLRDGAAAVLYGREEIEVGSADLNDVRLALSSGLDMTGTIAFEGGPEPALTTARISLSDASLSGAGTMGPSPTATVNKDHSFVVPNVMPGRWRVAITLAPFDGYIRSIRLGDQDGLQGDLEIAPLSQGTLRIVAAVKGGSVEGTVRSDHVTPPQPLEGAGVLLLQAGEHAPPAGTCAAAVADRDGHYRFAGLAPGKYRILAFEEMEPFACRDPDFLQTVEGRGREFPLAPEEKTVQDLTPADPR